MLYNTVNPCAIKTVKIDSKLRDTYNSIRLIRFPDYSTKINTKTNTKTDTKYNTKLTDFPYNQLLYDIDISNNYHLRMIFTPNTLNAKEYNYFAYKLNT